nr:MAG TPA: hypothetical protein [Caudoviricetes sp.]
MDFITADTNCQVRRRVVFPATCPASWTSKTQQVGYQRPITALGLDLITGWLGSHRHVLAAPTILSVVHYQAL